MEPFSFEIRGGVVVKFYEFKGVFGSVIFFHIFSAGALSGRHSAGALSGGHSARGIQRGTFSGGALRSSGGHGPKMPPLATGL